MPSRRTIALVTGAALLLGAAGAGAGVAIANAGDGPTPSRAAADRPCGRPYVSVLPTEEAPKSEPAAGEDPEPHLELREIGTAEQPTTAAFLPGTSGDGVVGQREGQVVRIAGGELTDDVVLDLEGVTQTEGDGGLLGVAYDPDGEWLYVYRATDERDEMVTAYPVDDAGVPDQEGEVEVLYIDHPPSEQHHGGGFAFGPDGMLYIGTGDGGGLGDPRENAEDGDSLLGKILRIDPTPEAAEPYAIPADNPFAGDDGVRDEIYALGVRNPFRLSFDAVSHDLWVGDVGQSCWEELNRLAPTTGPGADLGWDRREGTAAFEGGRVGDDELAPELTYAHRAGWCAIVAGYVVRPGEAGGGLGGDLDGWLLHTDYCRGRIAAFRPGGGDEPPALRELGLRAERPVAIVPAPDGSAWVLTLEGPVYRLSLVP